MTSGADSHRPARVGDRPSAKAASDRWLLTFAIDGDLRFLSHRDTIRLFERALTRARLPVRYSEGFNPHARLSILVPRPVGVASEAEMIIVPFEREVDGRDVMLQLARHMPAGARLIAAGALAPGARVRPTRVRCRLEPPVPSEAQRRDWARVAERVLAAKVVEIERHRPKTQRTTRVNVRPFIRDLRVEDDAIEFTLIITGEGGAKPAEVAALFGFDPKTINHRIRRLEVQWITRGSGTGEESPKGIPSENDDATSVARKESDTRNGDHTLAEDEP